MTVILQHAELVVDCDDKKERINILIRAGWSFESAWRHEDGGTVVILSKPVQ